jgi:ABC-type multidrug transport system permease subunit
VMMVVVMMVMIMINTFLPAWVVAHAFSPSTQGAEAGGSLSSRPVWSTE